MRRRGTMRRSRHVRSRQRGRRYPLKANVGGLVSKLEKSSRELKQIRKFLIGAYDQANRFFPNTEEDTPEDYFMGALEEVQNFARNMKTLLEYLDDAIIDGKKIPRG